MTPLLVGITRGSGSGKSSLARRLVDGLDGLHACVLAHDAYDLDRRALPPAALDGALFRDRDDVTVPESA